MSAPAPPSVPLLWENVATFDALSVSVRFRIPPVSETGPVACSERIDVVPVEYTTADPTMQTWSAAPGTTFVSQFVPSVPRRRPAAAVPGDRARGRSRAASTAEREERQGARGGDRETA